MTAGSGVLGSRPSAARGRAPEDAPPAHEGDFDGIFDGLRFSLDVELAPADILASIRARPDILCHARAPGQQRVERARERFEAWELTASGFRLRARPQRAGDGEAPDASAPVRSPTLVVEMTALPDRTRVTGRIVQAGVPVEFVQEYSRLLGFAAVVAALGSLGVVYLVPSMVVVGELGGFGVFLIAGVLMTLALRAALLEVTRLVSRRWDERTRLHGPALRGLFGELLVPHALPAATPRPDPFRLRALRAPQAPPSPAGSSASGPALEICMR